MVKALNLQIVSLFRDIVIILMKLFGLNVANVKCVKIVAYSLSVLGKQEEVIQIIRDNFDEVVSVMVSGLGKGGIEEMNVDVLMNMTEFLNKVTEIDI